VFHIDVAKVDQDVVYVAMAIYACCKGVFQIFYLFFRSMLQVCLFWMLRMFYAYVAGVLFECCICLQ
jgi:hypothetical protein